MTRYRIISILFLFLCAATLPARTQAAQPLETSANQAIVMDYETGAVLFEKNADQKMPTSSMSKVMTVYAVFEGLKNGQLRLDDRFLVSEKAWRMGGSKMFVEVDKRVPVEDLIRGVVVQSGNDATIVLAEGLAGSEEAFASMLTKKARALGMDNSNFTNASGWPDENHYSTARDLAILARALIHDFPDYYPYFAEKEYTYNNIPQRNRNPLLYRDMGADGVKTGHTESAGYGLIGSGTHQGRRVIVVVNGLEDEKARAQESAKLLEWGLRAFRNQKLFTANETVAMADVVLGQSRQVPLTVEHDLTATLPAVDSGGLEVSVRYTGPVEAPVRKGQMLGELEVQVPLMKPRRYELVAAKDVPELGFFARALARARLVLAGEAGS